MKLQTILAIVIIILVMLLVISCTNEQTIACSTEETSSIHSCFTPNVQSTHTPISHPSPSTYTPVPTIVEPGLAFGNPCKPPCWRGLVPGQSTRQEVDRVTEQLRMDSWVYRVVSSTVGGYSFFPLPRTMEGSIDVEMDNDIVEYIEGDIEFRYTLGEMVEQFGPPEGVRRHGGYATCTSCEMREDSTAYEFLGSYFLYPQQGLLFFGSIRSSQAGCLCPEMKLAGFCYYKPRSMIEVLEDNYLANLCLPALKDTTEDDLGTWHGFGGGY